MVKRCRKPNREHRGSTGKKSISRFLDKELPKRNLRVKKILTHKFREVQFCVFIVKKIDTSIWTT